MKYFLVEIKTNPNNTLRTQCALSLASLAIMIENGKLEIQSIKEITFDELTAIEKSGIKSGFCNIMTA